MPNNVSQPLMIVATAIELGHNLHLEVTAEGVEDSETLLALREMGCDKIQGYFLTKPLAANDFIKWLQKTTWH
ncbi:MAG: EAL domain-containing protein [Gammaproteobacteria bacterium]